MLEDRSVEVLWVARYDYNSGWELNRHKHNYYQIIYFIEGAGEIYLNEEEFSIQENLVLLIKPGEKHGLIASKGVAVKTLDLKFFIKAEELKKEISILSGVFQAPNLELKKLLLKIKEEGNEKNDYYKVMSNIFLYEILVLILRQKHCEKNIKVSRLEDEILDKNNDNVIKKVEEFVTENYSEPINLEFISQKLGYNKSYICQKFKKNLNCTPMNYVYWFRISKAKEFITYSDYSLKQIANMTGFQSIHHFTRVFHKYEGITPGQCHEEMKQDIRKDIYLNENFETMDLARKVKRKE